jgi:hypothetical protein
MEINLLRGLLNQLGIPPLDYKSQPKVNGKVYLGENGALLILLLQVSTYVGTFHKGASLGGNSEYSNIKLFIYFNFIK